VNFLENFVNARNVGTPLVKINTPDAASTIANVRKALGKDQTKIPLASWDAITGLNGINDAGTEAVAKMLSAAGVEKEATVVLPVTLQAIRNPQHADFICFIHNAHMFWTNPGAGNDPLVIQGIWNCRDCYKANGMMLLMLTPLGTVLPLELNNDVLSLEEALPTRAEIRKIVKEIYNFAKVTEPSAAIYEKAGDALVGIAAFPAEQAAAMNLNKASGVLNVAGLWERKREIVKASPGLSFYDGKLTLDDMGGGENIKQYMSGIMKGKRGANVILRVDEIEKAFAGAGTDTSGVKGDLLGNFLSWVEDKNVFCVLELGVPGASKSHFIYCLGGTFEKPVINFDIAGMQDSLVGNSGKNLRNAEATVEAISDGQIILIATANSLRGLPAELLSRFEKGGIFFFDTPDENERKQILALKIKKYALNADQQVGFNVSMTNGWTGREIESLCDKADRLGMTLVEAAKYVVPLTVSQKTSIEELRHSATDRYLSASKPGRYQYTAPKEVINHAPVVSEGGSGQRKLR
jgi:hypothetical protein